MREIIADELKTILAKHKLWLQGHADGSRANLSETNLSRANLSETNLSWANLSRANLSETNLSRANLSETNLSWANLSRANLSETNLSWANLSRANLSRANLSRANLSRANLSWANLSWADLSWANLSRANLSETNLSETNLSRANLSRANLSRANLSFIRDDIWSVLSASPAEVPGLLVAVREGRIDGSVYSGYCCCLVGTLGKLRGGNETCIPGLKPNSGRAAEAWFTSIKPGQTPENHQPSKLAAEWIEDWLTRVRAAIPALQEAKS